MRQSWLCMVLAAAALSTHTKQQCISRRGLAGAVVAAAGIVPKQCAASVEDLPPDALKALARYQGTLQIAADTFVFGIGEQAKDPKAVGRSTQGHRAGGEAQCITQMSRRGSWCTRITG